MADDVRDDALKMLLDEEWTVYDDDGYFCRRCLGRKDMGADRGHHYPDCAWLLLMRRAGLVDWRRQENAHEPYEDEGKRWSRVMGYASDSQESQHD